MSRNKREGRYAGKAYGQHTRVKAHHIHMYGVYCWPSSWAGMSNYLKLVKLKRPHWKL